MNEKQCPLCGEPLDDGQGVFCLKCDESAKKRNSLNLLFEEDLSQLSNDEVEMEKEPNSDLLEEGVADHVEIPKPKKRLGLILSILFIVILLSGAGIALFILDKNKKEEQKLELSFWFACIEENTPQSYSRYLQTYPMGQFNAEAQAKITGLRQKEADDWSLLQKAGNLQDYYAFVEKYPKTPFRNKIKHIMDSLSWIVAEKQNTSESYLVYIENSKLGTISGYYASIAQGRYDYLKFVTKVESEELETVKGAISDYFKYLSTKNYAKLSEVLSVTVTNFYGEKNRSSEKILKTLKADINRNQINSLSYTPNFKDITILRDSSGVYFTDMVIDKKITYEKKRKKKPESITELLHIELMGDLKIKSIFVSPLQDKN